MGCDETNRKMNMMVVLCFSFCQARRYGASFGRGDFSILVYGIDGRKQVCLLLLGDVVWLKFCLLTLGSVYTIPYRTSLMFFCFCSSFSMRPSSLMGVWCST